MRVLRKIKKNENRREKEGKKGGISDPAVLNGRTDGEALSLFSIVDVVSQAAPNHDISPGGQPVVASARTARPLRSAGG